MADKINIPGGTSEFDATPAASLPTVVLVLALLAIFLTFVGAVAIVFFPKANPEQARAEADALMAADITGFSESVETAVLRFKEHGISARDIDFSVEATGANALFSTDSNVVYRPAPSLGAGLRPNWEFKVPYVDGSGWYVTGMGKDGVGGADVIMVLQGLPRSVCAAINQRLGYAGDGQAQKVFEQRAQTDLSIPSPPNRVTPESSLAAAPGHGAACLKNGAVGDSYLFYRVLEAY